MALAYSFSGAEQVKGPYKSNPASAPLHIMRGTLSVTGTYATGGDQLDFCKFFTGPAFTVGSSPAGQRGGATALRVIWVKAFGDYDDGTTKFSANVTALGDGGTATSISAASTGNLVTIKAYSGVNDGSGSEISNTTAMGGSYGVLFGCEITTVGKA